MHNTTYILRLIGIDKIIFTSGSTPIERIEKSHNTGQSVFTISQFKVRNVKLRLIIHARENKSFDVVQLIQEKKTKIFQSTFC